ncbi:GNAT family N-acetyltransferase [Salibacterium lacus]|uniref:GNAT family N-acetyltransferase n=1 Tax=Salibacterium lacus TaxID=1898109 RepID=A0ABW5T4B2_9BACI
MFLYQVDEGTTLKMLDRSDTEALFSLTRKYAEELKTWLPWVEHTTTSADTKAFIRSAMQQFADGNGWQAGIRHHGDLAGVIGFHYIDEVNRAASIGYWIAPPFEKRGLVTTSCRALLAHAFDELDLHRVEIKAAKANEKSRAVPALLGFQEEGQLRGAERVNGTHLDVIVYSMLQEEWKRGG